MGALLGLGTGIGVLLIWSAFALPRAPRPRRDRPTASARLVATCVLAGLAAAVAVDLLTRTPPVALVFGAMAGWLPASLARGRERTRRREYAEAWPDAVDDLASGVRAGMALPEALADLATRGPAPLRPAFERFALDYQVTGRFGECLDRLKERLDDPVGDRVVEGLRVAREVGGGELGRLLRNLSSYLRDEARTRGELESRQAWSVVGARLAVAAPWVVLLFTAFQPEVIRRYASPGGALVLLVGAGCCVVAYRLMRRIGRLPTERRILS